MQRILAALRERAFGHWRTSAAGVALACAALGLMFGADIVRHWVDGLTAGNELAVVVTPLVLVLLRDPGKQ
jgi:hypothetical protein